MTRVRRIGIGSMARMMAALYFFIGIVISLIMWLFGLMIPDDGTSSGMFAFGGMFLLVMPVIYAAIGVIMGAFIAGIYNMVAGWTGGLELELVQPE